jgi:hypothetical protein
MLSGVTETARWTMNKDRRSTRLLEETTERMRRDASQIYSRELARAGVRAAVLPDRARRGGGDWPSAQTASTYLKELTAIGILREHKMGTREDLPQSGVHRSAEARLNELGAHHRADGHTAQGSGAKTLPPARLARRLRLVPRADNRARSASGLG